MRECRGCTRFKVVPIYGNFIFFLFITTGVLLAGRLCTAASLQDGIKKSLLWCLSNIRGELNICIICSYTVHRG